MTLTGKVWPIHFGRESGEAITSWISRLALVHFQVPSTFFMRTVPEHADQWKQDLDVTCPEYVLTAIGKRCSKSRQHIENGTLSPIRSHFDPYDGTSTALPRWVSPVYIRRYTPHHRGWRICPLCLRENAYFRLYWRFLFSFACVKHKLLLWDECPRCAALICSHKVNPTLLENFPVDALAFCHVCGFDLREAPLVPASADEIACVRLCTQAVRKGFCNVDSLNFNYTHLFLQGLRIMAKGLLRESVRPLLDDKGRAQDVDLQSAEKKHVELEFLPIVIVRHLLTTGIWLMKNWPKRFLAACKEHELHYSDWIRPRDTVPYWFASILKRHLLVGNITSFKKTTQ